MSASMVPVTTAATGFEARLLAARLGAEGFLWELRGNVDGPYPVGPVQVLVPADQVDAVRALLLVDEVEEAFAAAANDGAGRAASARATWVLVVLLVGTLAFAVARVGAPLT